MIGSFITRGLLMVFGYAYPAYECFKTVEKNKPEIEQLRFWCQYWILVAILTVSERIGDAFISWVPMYSEAKLAFYIYLWYPKTKGTTYVYNSFFRPYVAKHETEIDRNLLELKVRAGDIAGSYWQKAASYGQTRVLEVLQYIASRSTPRPRPVQPQNPSVRVRQNSGTAQPQSEVPPTPVSSASGEGLDEVQEVSGHSQTPQASLPPNTQSKSIAAALNTRRTISLQLNSEVASASTATEVEAASSANQNANPPQKETLMEEAVRVTRATLRKARAAASH